MSSLSVYHVSSPDLPNKVLTHLDDIAATLAEQSVRFERWQAAAPILSGASHEEMIGAYQVQIDQLMTERGYIKVDVVSVTRDQPLKAELSAPLLEEHRQDEEVVRFFVAGRGLFYLHIGDYVYAVLCEKNDLISIPAGTPHWFDMGDDPHVVAIRVFNTAQGQVAQPTNASIASHFPRLDD